MHITNWFTLILVDHTMSLGFNVAYCQIVSFDCHRPYSIMLNLMFSLIIIDHTLSLRFRGANSKMVYFDSHRPYNVSNIP